MTVLCLHFCVRAFFSCGKWRPLFIAVRGPLTIAASLVAEHRLQMRRLSNCGSRTQLLRGMWNLPRPGLEPVSPALAGRFSTTAPPGKPTMKFLYGYRTLYFLYLGDSFFSLVREFFSYCLFRYFLRPSLFSFWIPYNVNIGTLAVVPEVS